MSIQQFHKYPCSFCKKNEATQLCDFVVDYGAGILFSSRNGGHMPPHPETCDNQICKSCAIRYNGHEFCPSCDKLFKYIIANRDRRMNRLLTDKVFEDMVRR